MSVKPLRIVLLSSTTFGYECLANGILQSSDVQVAGIITTPPKINISYSEKPVVIQTYADFTDIAQQIGCEQTILSGKMTSQAYLNPIKQWQPDMLIALGWYYMIPRKVRDSVPLGCAGIHASLLPKYRGGAPINWAIINGEQETGVTFFYFDDGVDNGDMIAQEKFPILYNDTCATVYDKATQASISILRASLPKLANGTASRIHQDESQATYCDQRKPEDGLIDWSWNATRIRNFIRAQTRPYPGAFTYLNGKKVIIWDADIFDEEQH